jgi:hypothetical protein
MRYLSRLFFVLLGGSLAFSTVVHAQEPWSAVLSSSRAINWTNAGLPATLPDGETTANPWTPPSRTAQYGSTIGPSGSASTDLSNINTALSNCPNGDFVLLGPGTFLIQGTVKAYTKSCSLRGSGPQSTTLSLSGSGIIWMGAASGGGSCSLTAASNYSVGSTTLTCTGVNGTAPAVGDIVGLSQCDTGFGGSPCSGTSADNGGLFVCSYQTTCMTEPATSGPNRSQQQNFVITSVSNSSGTYTIGVNTGLYMPNWTYAQSPALSWNNPSSNGNGVGIEDMTIYFSGSASVQNSVQMQNTYASWVKGVRFLGSPTTSPVGVSGSKNGLISNNYFFPTPSLSGAYLAGINFQTTSDTLVLNNIFNATVEPIEGYGGNTGDVFAYNFARDAFTEWPFDTTYDHHAYSSFDLFEGNEFGKVTEDDTWGTHDLNTYFRNFLPCDDTPYTTYSSEHDPLGIAISSYQRFDNLVGNAIGTSGLCSSYQGTNNGSGYVFGINTSDPLAGSTLMRWGNVSVATQSTDTPANSGIRFVSSEVPSTLTTLIASLTNLLPSNNSLPCSFFLQNYTSTSCAIKTNGGTGLNWWSVCKTWSTFPTACATTQLQPFPFAGPDLSGGAYVNGYAYDNPAATAWQNLPVDTAYQNSYTISSSSWSNGKETLTISGSTPFPSGSVHIMGPFQMSGVSPACMTGATFGGNGEILMTGSSSTTVIFALAANPGVSCTGTLLFPDIRQFDERVYENDSTGQPLAPGTPTGLTGNAVPGQ